MGILQFIEKVCVQTAVYWGYSSNDGFGQKVLKEPIEIKVRWTDKAQIVRTGDGKEIACLAEVLVQQDLDMEGFLYLGSLSDFSPLDLSTPQNLTGVLEIKGFDKIPLLKSTDKFVRTAYLSGRANQSKSF